MIRYNSLKSFEDALKLIDATTEVFQFFSEAGLVYALENPPVGKIIARIEAGGNNIVAIFTASGNLATLFAGVKGGYYAIEAGAYVDVVLGTPVEVRVHDSPAALQAYLITKQADNTVVVYADEFSFNSVGAYRVVTQPGKYIAIKGTQPASMLFIRDYGNSKFVTVFK